MKTAWFASRTNEAEGAEALKLELASVKTWLGRELEAMRDVVAALEARVESDALLIAQLRTELTRVDRNLTHLAEESRKTDMALLESIQSAIVLNGSAPKG